MINSFDINPLTHELHLKELDRTHARHVERDDRVPSFETVYPKTSLRSLFAWFWRSRTLFFARRGG